MTTAMTTAKTPEQHAAAHYRLAVCRAKKRGQPIPDRAKHIAVYLSKHKEPAPLGNGTASDTAPRPVLPPVRQSGIVGDSGKGLIPETLKGETAQVETLATPPAGGVLQGNAKIAPQVRSGAIPHAGTETPARRPDGRFPSRRPLCTPATDEQFKHALALMSEGATMGAIRRDTGADWQALNERGLVDYPHDWPAIAQAWREARALSLIDRAQEIALQESPAEVSEVNGPMGTTTTERHKTDPAMISQALAGLLPDIHGKLASRSTTAVQVNISLVDAIAELERLEAASRPLS